MNDVNKGKINNYEKMKCIWMSSMVIDYKLCDKQFNCENCQFDKAMRNKIDKNESCSEISSPVDLISEKLHCLKYDDRIMYLNNSFIAKLICKNTYYLGINPILNSFLDTTSSLMMHECGENITAGKQWIRIYGSWGKLDLMAPGNLSIYDKVNSLDENPWNSKWIAIIGCDNNEIPGWLISKSKWVNIYNRAVGIIDDIKKRTQKDCETMYDGGSKVISLHQVVGNNKYFSILKSVAD